MEDNQKKFVFYIKGIDCKSFYDEKAKKTRYFIKGHIDSEDLDLVNDIVTKNCMVDIQKQFKARNIKLDLDHETIRKAKGQSAFDQKLNLTKVPLGKAIDETLDEKGNEIEFELNSNWKQLDSKGDVVTTFKETWENVKNKFYDAFSIAYIPIKTAYRDLGADGKARLLDKVNLINVALTGNAINPNATITNVMAKSLEYLKEHEGSTMENKGYDKDGAHAHTENEPLGEHNHVEIEKRIQSDYDYLSDRLSRISDRVYELEEGKPDGATAGLKGKHKKNKKGDTTMGDEEKKTPDGEDKPQDQGEETKPDANAEAGKEGKEAGAEGAEAKPSGDGAEAKPAEGAEAGAEEKSIDAKAVTELKGQVDVLNKSVDKINKVLEKALPAGHGAEDKSQLNQPVADTKSHATGTMDLI